MAEAEVTIEYYSRPVALACILVAAVLPVAILFAVWSVLVLLMAWGQGKINITVASLLMLGEVLAVGLMAWAAILFADQTIFVSRQGISVPIWMCPSLGFRTELSWNKLADIECRENSMILKFVRSKPFAIRYDRLDKENLEKIVVAVDVWAGGSMRFPQLAALKEGPDQAPSSSGGKSFTHLWDEELARRFGPTNFVPLEPGRSLQDGKFIVERQLGFGGLSAIYLVAGREREKFVLKEAVVPQSCEQTATSKAVEMFRREAELLAKLEHPQIAKVYDNFVEDGHHYMVLQYIRGEDLRRIVKEKGPQREGPVIAWATAVAEILTYLHSQTPPVLHRDISPDNLILRENGEICLIDFGAANVFLGTATGTMVGKQSYIAPEQLRGKACVQSDIYGLGCTVFYLLTGKDPLPLSVSSPCSLRPEVDSRLDSLVQDCTQLAAADRPPSAQSLASALRLLHV